MLPNCKFGRTGVKNLKVGKLEKGCVLEEQDDIYGFIMHNLEKM